MTSVPVVVFSGSVAHLYLHFFPTRRSSDLSLSHPEMPSFRISAPHLTNRYCGVREILYLLDRKSTRLNSSHVATSYAVFCLKKNKSIRNKNSNYSDDNRNSYRQKSHRSYST